MASDSHPRVVASTLGPLVNGNRRMALNPKATELLQSQVILPFSLGAATHAFLGPLLTLEEIQKVHSFLPCATDQSTLASQEGIFIK